MINTLSNNRLAKVLNDADIMKRAPSVFANTAWGENSDRYRFLPTINVINALRDTGFNVVMAAQSNSHIDGKKEFTKHIIRLRHRDLLNPMTVGDEVPEIVLVNSHDRTSAYKLMLGIFKLVCSNGMIVASQTIDSLNIRHTGNSNLLDNVIDISARVINEAPKAIEQINLFKSISLTPDEQLAFACSTAELNPSSIKVLPGRLIQHRRYDDRPAPDGSNNLWKTSNIIQENLIRGGVYGQNSKAKVTRTREIKCIKSNVDINKALWRLTEEMAKLKTAQTV